MQAPECTEHSGTFSHSCSACQSYNTWLIEEKNALHRREPMVKFSETLNKAGLYIKKKKWDMTQQETGSHLRLNQLLLRPCIHGALPRLSERMEILPSLQLPRCSLTWPTPVLLSCTTFEVALGTLSNTLVCMTVISWHNTHYTGLCGRNTILILRGPQEEISISLYLTVFDSYLPPRDLG